MSIEVTGTLPFDGDSTDAEIEVVFANRDFEITWVNSTSGHLQHVTMKKFLKVVRREDGRDYIDILTDEGYRSIYLRQIVSVG